MAMPGKISAYQRLMLRIASVLPEKFRAAFLHPAGTTLSKNLNFPKKKIFRKEKKIVSYLRTNYCIFLGTDV